MRQSSGTAARSRLVRSRKKVLRWMAFDPDDGIVLSVNPYLAFKQILISPFGNGLYDEQR